MDKTKVDLVGEKKSSKDAWIDQPSHMVEEEGQIEGILLAIVICNEIYWLKIVEKAL